MNAEKFADLPHGVRICYRDEGEGDPILLVIGLGFQLIHWPKALITGLLEAGYRVITFDNRDAGRSSRMEGSVPTLMQKLRRQAPEDAYTLEDMANDAFALLDHLKIERAHIAGMSLGGMIAQVMSAEQPDRAKTLTSIFSNTGARGLGEPGFRMMLQLARRPARTRKEFIDRYMQNMRINAGKDFPSEPQYNRSLFGSAWDRGGPDQHIGTGRQLAAVLASGDRTQSLGRITAPTLVIHGDRDPLVHPSGGTATAKAIPNARHVTIPGMGHEISVAAAPHLANLILEHTAPKLQRAVLLD